MKKISIYHVDAFTSVAFGGNPAGVVPDANNLTSEMMQKIAKEVNLSETAFLQTSENSHAADFRIRYFSPTNEIDFCGHATLATTWILLTELGYNNRSSITLETNVGLIEMELSSEGIMMTQLSPKLKEINSDLEHIVELVGLRIDDIDQRFACKLSYTGNWHLLVPVKTKEAVDRAKPNFEFLSQHNQMNNICTTHLFTFDSQEEGCLLYTRDFAPAVGILEDPVTGSANGALAGYLYLEGIVPSDRDYKFTIAQGHKLGRPGYVKVEILQGSESAKFKIGGKAVTTIAGIFQIPL
ncbi:PhzF family phenazine biosynthesis protein [Halalkalibacter akibai]|uniref:Phenazine biosynthesis protein PhzF n=1 Tax=Halalkalibacter akibai (strain ATCC 43226 / DSM 21942 / CIP 109018 / JCM 9157 / 1139) TaxID=1236973 RepID=W4QZ69_HALA3|nr:PhzF family phenazine biosynthesis protein [Halalkalibacter akibai]GAE36953.1 phenazine biosynthesis protein PhzF [Halalkalibacter akibai JCM 9157]